MTLADIIVIAFSANDCPQQSDAIILLQGDGDVRVTRAAELYHEGLAKRIVVSGGVRTGAPFALPPEALVRRLRRRSVPQERLILETRSRNTYEQGMEVMRLAKKYHWKRIILVASLFHQPRAYLTFLQAMKHAHMRLLIFNAPVFGLPWFTRAARSTRLKLLTEEMEKISTYRKKGHVINEKELLTYEHWKEAQQKT